MIAKLSQLWRGLKAPSPVLEGCVYAVGDIHGRADLLEDLVGRIGADFKTELKNNPQAKAELVFLGDYINRGPESAQVIAFLRHGIEPALRTALGLPATAPLPFHLTCLAGNHERASLLFMQNPATRPDWLNWGGATTLASYGIKPFTAQGPRAPAALAAELHHTLQENGDLAWLTALPLIHTIGPYAFVHAGVRPGIPLAEQMEADLTFIREDWWNRPHKLPYTVVFGHTPQPIPLVTEDRIGVDTGAYRTGILTAAVLRANQEPTFLQTQPKAA